MGIFQKKSPFEKEWDKLERKESVFLKGRQAVSYTHLDVYKRQILSNIGLDPVYLIILLFLIQVLLFVMLISVNMKYNRLKTSYSSFMKGKDGKNLEESMLCLLYTSSFKNSLSTSACSFIGFFKQKGKVS